MLESPFRLARINCPNTDGEIFILFVYYEIQVKHSADEDCIETAFEVARNIAKGCRQNKYSIVFVSQRLK